MNTTPPTAPDHYPVLDPCCLGRPVHLLDKFTALLRDDLAELLRTRLNRRYRASFQVGKVQLAQTPALPARRWRVFDHGAGRVAFSMDRRLLLSILAYRYGAASVPEADGEPQPETATEERLCGLLGKQFVATLAQRVALLPGADTTWSAESGEPAEIPLTPPVERTWLLRAELVEPGHGISGELLFALDEAWMSRILRGVAPAAERTRPGKLPPKPLAARLPLVLVARLLEKELPLGALLDARVGDVIPMQLGPTEVLIGNSLLFRAAVAEHKGKLCLTSFEDVE